MLTLSWPEADAPSSPVTMPVFRFPKKNFPYKIWLYGPPTIRYVHYSRTEGTLPCMGDGCALCTLEKAQEWRRRTEGYSAALLDMERLEEYHPIVTVFTQAALASLGSVEEGLNVEVTRVESGNSFRYKIVRGKVVRPMPGHGFAVEPILLNHMFKGRSDLPRVVMPEPIKYERPAQYVPPNAEPLQIGPDERAKVQAALKAYLAKANAPAAPVEPTAVVQANPPEPVPVVLPSRLRTSADPTPLDISEHDLLTRGTGSLTCDHVAARLPAGHPAKPSANGQHAANGKGGVK